MGEANPVVLAGESAGIALSYGEDQNECEEDENEYGGMDKMSIQVKNYLSEDIEEELYANHKTIPAGTTTPLKVEAGKIRDGYEAIAVSVAVLNNSDCAFFLKIKDKQHYPNGLNCKALAAGQYLNKEVPLLVDIGEGAAWEVGFTNTGGAPVDMFWRFRIRLFKK